MDVLLSVVAVVIVLAIDGHDYCNLVLTVSDDGSEVDVTWWTGGPRLHFLWAWMVPVSPPRGAA